ncbi:acetoacetate decarboxylase family protein [Arthrobacter sp. KN11-1C]|uniref:acetoacetate decarboxylase family protein n=1 Tax=Arthrobacter sp. KN11-1C TaxID=3445774 RepID=UPI003F9F5006
MVKKQAEIVRGFELDWLACEQGPEEVMRSNSDFMVITAKGDLEQLNKWVPAPLEATGDVIIDLVYLNETVQDGVKTWEYPFYDFNIGIVAKLTEPPYTEGVFLVQSYVDDDFSLVFGREVWGYPKKMGDFEVSPHPNEESSRYEYSVSRRGTELVSVTLDGLETIPAEEFPGHGVGYTICFRQVPSPDAVAIEKQQLVFVKVETDATEAKKGIGTVTIKDGPFDQLGIGPLTDVTAYFARGAVRHHGINNLVVEARELARPLDVSRAGVPA